MKTAFKLTLAAITLLMLTACGKKDETVAEPKAPPIPTMTVNQILDMSKNERQELERRCLGISHPTCNELKGDSFKKLKDLRISMCRLGAAQKGLYDRSGAAREERQCDEMF
jgi:hypothetical protein